MKVIKSINLILLSVVSALLVQSCDIKDNVAEPEEAFVQIYNNDKFTGGYSPIDVKQNSDSTYIILGTANTWDTYIMQVDKDGKFRWHMILPEPYVNPVGELIKIQNELYFVCMNDVTLNTYIMKVNTQNRTIEEHKSIPLTYPLHASLTPDNGMLILGYNRDTRSTTLSKLDANFTITWKNEYEVLEDAEEAIISHITKTGEILPFLTGYSGESTATKYFFNGFSLYTLSLHFVNTTDGTVTGTIDGFSQKGGISAVSALDGGKYALARFNFGDNYFLPFQDVNISGTVFSGDLVGNAFPEVTPHATVKTLRINKYNKKIVLYGTQTKSNYIALYAFDATSGELMGTKYLGRTNPFNFSNFCETLDGGLMVTGTTHLAGRFPRIVVFKLSERELDQLMGI